MNGKKCIPSDPTWTFFGVCPGSTLFAQTYPYTLDIYGSFRGKIKLPLISYVRIAYF